MTKGIEEARANSWACWPNLDLLFCFLALDVVANKQGDQYEQDYHKCIDRNNDFRSVKARDNI